jgi:hypothetical protein
MPAQRAKRLLMESYQLAGLQVQEFCLQALMRAYLGPGPIPLTPDEELKAMPFLVRLAGLLKHSVQEHGTLYDFGKRAAVVCEPGGLAPRLTAMLNLMQSEQQSVGQAIDELQQLRDTVHVLFTHLRAVKAQNDASIASVSSLLNGVEPFGHPAAHFLGRRLE